MRLLLIGHRGYLGQGLLRHLEKGHRVLGWDKEEDLFKLDAALLKREGVEGVINLSVMADRGAAGFSIDTPSDRVNVEGARHLARVLKGSQAAWIQFSTREVFGQVYAPSDVTKTAAGYRPKFLVAEDHAFSPLNSYAKSKLIAEFISESHPYSTVVRLSTCYTDAPAPSGNWVVQILNNAVQGKPVTLTRKGWQFRDPLHCDDLGRLLELILEKKVYGERIHAGGGKENLISLREFVRLVAPDARIQDLPGGDYGFALDNRKAFRLTGWKPRVLFRRAIPALADAARRSLAAV